MAELTGRLKIVAKVIRRRVQAGEDRDTVFDYYNLLTDDEKAAIVAYLDAEETGGTSNA